MQGDCQPGHRNQIVVSARLGLVLSASVAARRSSGSQRVAIPGQVVALVACGEWFSRWWPGLG
jgi:hypothetical protein